MNIVSEVLQISSGQHDNSQAIHDDKHPGSAFAVCSVSYTTGVLKEKKKGEDTLKSSGLPYTIVRPGRLTDGPYTSFDLNTLLKATSGARQGVKLSNNDDLQEEASRIAVAGTALEEPELSWKSKPSLPEEGPEGCVSFLKIVRYKDKATIKCSRIRCHLLEFLKY